jgi:A/G-specific adenine glycosylase
MDKRYFSKKLVEWYDLNKRNLPWRLTTDPYKIWLSEIILQQTRVQQGLPYYERFVKNFPDVETLASAKEEDVLRLWQGLGYYSRARNLHKCAKKIHEKTGLFPDNFRQLRELPGIGDYTAAAIASFSFNENVAVVDGNVFRVLSRLFGIASPINSTDGKTVFTTLANELLNPSDPATHNQAVMEFGATFCVPANPPCERCIFKRSCVAYSQSLQSDLPVKKKNPPSRKRYFHYLVYRKGTSLMMKKRDEKDIWFGLYDFPLIEKTRPVSAHKILSEIKQSKRKMPATITPVYKHILSHQTILCKFIIVPWDKSGKQREDSRFYSLKRISDLPKPVLISRFLDDLAFYS